MELRVIWNLSVRSFYRDLVLSVETIQETCRAESSGSGSWPGQQDGSSGITEKGGKFVGE